MRAMSARVIFRAFRFSGFEAEHVSQITEAIMPLGDFAAGA